MNLCIFPDPDMENLYSHIKYNETGHAQLCASDGPAMTVVLSHCIRLEPNSRHTPTVQIAWVGT